MKKGLDKFLEELTKQALEQEDIDLIPVVRTENNDEDPLSPVWDKIEKRQQVICNGDLKSLLKFTVMKFEQETSD